MLRRKVNALQFIFYSISTFITSFIKIRTKECLPNQ
jgi:hypothetical protein